MKTLLQKAKEQSSLKKSRLIYTKEDAELAISWMKGEITSTQVMYAKGKKTSGNILYYIACALRAAYRFGMIKEKL